MRQLIEQMLDCIEELKYSNDTFTSQFKSNAAITAAREYLAQPEQSEPVAWMTEDGRVCTTSTKAEAMHRHTASNFSIPLYTHPAQPKAPEQDKHNGWYCSHCQCRVDNSDVTFHEQHTVCGRVITDDKAPEPLYDITTIQTAEDLADLIDLCWTNYTIQAKASTMLRQQAAEITSLHREIDDAHKRIAQPEQSEPVGYVYSQDGRKEGCIQDSSIPNGTPLYTQPKAPEPLTDGEIYTAYIEATNQTLRAQDERLALAFARAVLAAQGAKK